MRMKAENAMRYRRDQVTDLDSASGYVQFGECRGCYSYFVRVFQDHEKLWRVLFVCNLTESGSREN